MTTAPEQKKRGIGWHEKPYPKPIEASPEEIASVVLKAKPKKDWQYLKEEQR